MRKTIEGTPDIDALATLYIETLVRVYEFSEEDELFFSAPLITEKLDQPVDEPTDCLSVSALMRALVWNRTNFTKSHRPFPNIAAELQSSK